jgi:hypothetical protein
MLGMTKPRSTTFDVLNLQFSHEYMALDRLSKMQVVSKTRLAYLLRKNDG